MVIEVNNTGRKRRTHQSLSVPQLTPCRNCHAPKQSHRVCPQCGHYAGREVVNTEES